MEISTQCTALAERLLNALSTFRYEISNGWLLLVYNKLGGFLYSLAFSGLFVGVAVRCSGCQDSIGPEDEDKIVNLYQLWECAVNYDYN